MEEHANEFVRWLPLAGFAIKDGVIRLWYGDKAEPVLELEPIQAENLRD